MELTSTLSYTVTGSVAAVTAFVARLNDAALAGNDQVSDLKVAVSREIEVETPPAKKRGRPPKAAETPPPAAAEDLDFGEPEEEEEEENEEETEGEEGSEEEEEAPKSRKGATAVKGGKAAKAAPSLTLEDDIIPAFQKYAKNHSREKAGKVLTKFGVKSVRDLTAEQYPKVMKELGV